MSAYIQEETTINQPKYVHIKGLFDKTKKSKNLLNRMKKFASLNSGNPEQESDVVSSESFQIHNGELHKVRSFDGKLMKLGKNKKSTEKFVNMLIAFAKDKLKTNNFPILEDEFDFIVECWSYNSTGETTIETTLAIHIDDEGAINKNVETCIIYTEKSKDIEGGNLTIYKDGEGKYAYDKLEELEIETGDVVLMSGNLPHQPTDVEGNGVRNCIVIQIQSKRVNLN